MFLLSNNPQRRILQSKTWRLFCHILTLCWFKTPANHLSPMSGDLLSFQTPKSILTLVFSNTTLGDWSWLKDVWFNVRWLETPNIMFGVWKCQTWWLKDVTLVTIFTFGHIYHRKQVGSCLRTSLDKFEQVWTSLDQFGPVLTSLNRFGQIWTSFDIFGWIYRFEQV